ncbi:MlaE family ABC transporter permease [Trujillonella endophytica]|uniref:Phospholipid/cholesterol/gamma-HCH transport system permease protein n=1 Tax=Trujillonella endophytica TaxID=673521 RepID=A0A1H8RKD5_9ACTN|nr:ABC transporter permease [Trujillella endophytica]SEO67009.1 phospholipid/cholesterol/gamma-HCH transport system permease protein [Trujillella endophytica]
MALLSPVDRIRVGVRKAVRGIYRRPLDTLDDLGDQLGFYGRALAWTPRTLRRYKKEVARLLAEVTFGTGALAVIGGTVGVIAFLSFFTGTEVGLQGYAALDQLGTSAFTGFLSAYFNTREIAPLVAGLALSATVGCGFTAQIGAMRINEEIDALEVMGVPSLPFLVTTRIVAGFIAVVPLYVIGLLSSYFATRTITTQAYAQSAGTYDHYFNLFLPPQDVLWSFVKVLVFAVVIILSHCYYGYRAAGGPAGVGLAVGRAVRFSIVAVMVIDLFLSLAIWGSTTTVRIAG